ncbi:hypothetical protein FKM82_029307 [Ascaphus truei]
MALLQYIFNSNGPLQYIFSSNGPPTYIFSSNAPTYIFSSNGPYMHNILFLLLSSTYDCLYCQVIYFA